MRSNFRMLSFDNNALPSYIVMICKCCMQITYLPSLYSLLRKMSPDDKMWLYAKTFNNPNLSQYLRCITLL